MVLKDDQVLMLSIQFGGINSFFTQILLTLSKGRSPFILNDFTILFWNVILIVNHIKIIGPSANASANFSVISSNFPLNGLSFLYAGFDPSYVT
jgi:hypothetical protein